MNTPTGAVPASSHPAFTGYRGGVRGRLMCLPTSFPFASPEADGCRLISRPRPTGGRGPAAMGAPTLFPFAALDRGDIAIPVDGPAPRGRGLPRKGVHSLFPESCGHSSQSPAAFPCAAQPAGNPRTVEPSSRPGFSLATPVEQAADLGLTGAAINSEVSRG